MTSATDLLWNSWRLPAGKVSNALFNAQAIVCFFSSAGGDPGPCTTDNVHNSGKVAPVVVGMFNINGSGKGNAFGASAKMDGSGSGLISKQPN